MKDKIYVGPLFMSTTMSSSGGPQKRQKHRELHQQSSQICSAPLPNMFILGAPFTPQKGANTKNFCGDVPLAYNMHKLVA